MSLKTQNWNLCEALNVSITNRIKDNHGIHCKWQPGSDGGTHGTKNHASKQTLDSWRSYRHNQGLSLYQ